MTVIRSENSDALNVVSKRQQSNTLSELTADHRDRVPSHLRLHQFTEEGKEYPASGFLWIFGDRGSLETVTKRVQGLEESPHALHAWMELHCSLTGEHVPLDTDKSGFSGSTGASEALAVHFAGSALKVKD